MSSREIPGREPWAITFSTLRTYLGCALAAVLFTGLLWAWLELVVPDYALEPEDSLGRITIVFGTAAAILLLLVGPLLAWLVGIALRRSGSTAVHVIAFTFAGSVMGGLAGLRLGPDVAVTLIVTLGLAAGLARLLMAPFGRRPTRTP